MSDSKRIQTASHWGVYDVHLKDGEISGVTAFNEDPGPPALIQALPQMVRSPLRIDQPYVRAGYLKSREASRAGRGAEPFVPVTWDVAMDLVEDGLRRVKSEFGNESIYGGSYGWASAGRLHHSPSVLKRFLGLFGGYVDKRGNHSFGAAMHIAPYVIGSSDVTSMAVPWAHIAEHTELVVMFGGAHVKNMQIDAGGAAVHEAEQWIARIAHANVEFVNISPARDNVSELLKADWLPAFVLQVQVEDQWKPVYRFDLDPQYPVDYEMSNHFVSTYPNSLFVSNLLGARLAPGRRIGLFNRTLHIHDQQTGTHKRELSGAQELRSVLRSELGITLPEESDGLDAALARLP